MVYLKECNLRLLAATDAVNNGRVFQSGFSRQEQGLRRDKVPSWLAKPFEIKDSQAVLSIGLHTELHQTMVAVRLRKAAVKVRKSGRRRTPFAKE